MSDLKTLVVFSHGKESGPWGSKIEALAALARGQGAEVISIDYRLASDDGGGDRAAAPQFDADARIDAGRRLEKLLAHPLPIHQRLVLVGSSMGAWVATAASPILKPDGLFLLAPAFFMDGYPERALTPHARRTLIIHGWRDTVVPPQNSVRFAQEHRCSLHVLDDDHRLNDAIDDIAQLFSNFLSGSPSAVIPAAAAGMGLL